MHVYVFYGEVKNKLEIIQNR